MPTSSPLKGLYTARDLRRAQLGGAWRTLACHVLTAAATTATKEVIKRL